MHRHRLAIATNNKASNHRTIWPFKHHATADLNLLQHSGCLLLMEKLQSLNDVPVQFHQRGFIQTINIELGNRRLLHRAIYTTFLGKRNYGRLQLTVQLHNKMAPPTDMPRLLAVKTIQLATNCALKLYAVARSGLSPVPESGGDVNGGEGAMCSGLVFDRPYDAGEAKEGA